MARFDQLNGQNAPPWNYIGAGTTGAVGEASRQATTGNNVQTTRPVTCPRSLSQGPKSRRAVANVKGEEESSPRPSRVATGRPEFLHFVAGELNPTILRAKEKQLEVVADRLSRSNGPRRTQREPSVRLRRRSIPGTAIQDTAQKQTGGATEPDNDFECRFPCAGNRKNGSDEIEIRRPTNLKKSRVFSCNAAAGRGVLLSSRFTFATSAAWLLGVGDNGLRHVTGAAWGCTMCCRYCACT